MSVMIRQDVRNYLESQAELEKEVINFLKKIGIPFELMRNETAMRAIVAVGPRGRFVGIIVEPPGFNLLPDQKRFIDKFNKVGGLAFVVHSVDDVAKSIADEFEDSPVEKKKTKQEQTCEWLLNKIKSGVVSLAELIRLADEEGLHRQQLYRAKDQLIEQEVIVESKDCGRKSWVLSEKMEDRLRQLDIRDWLLETIKLGVTMMDDMFEQGSKERIDRSEITEEIYRLCHEGVVVQKVIYGRIHWFIADAKQNLEKPSENQAN